MVDCEVAVVGAGPAGASAARSLLKSGISAVIIVERKRLPRHKPCSGLLIPKSIALIKEHFGTPPPEIFAQPDYFKAMRWHFSSGRMLATPIGTGAQSVWRNRFDKWLCDQSGGRLMDAATLVAFDEGWEGLTLHCQRREGEQVNIRCQAIIAADGRFSSVVNTIDHSGQNGMKLFIAWQNLYEARCDIEPGF